jgi:hypothetical protein
VLDLLGKLFSFSIHIPIYLSGLSLYLSMALQSFVIPWQLFQFLILCTVGRTLSTGDQPNARPLPTHRTTQTHNKRTQIFMSWVGFEPTIPAFERTNTVHVLDRAATVIGTLTHSVGNMRSPLMLRQVVHTVPTALKDEIVKLLVNVQTDFYKDWNKVAV